MNTESELYKAGHPSTWSIGDVIRNESYGAIVKITGWEDREDGKFIGTLVEASNSAIGPIPKGGAWDGDFTRADYVLIRRANQQEKTEGSGECQSRSNVPDSAGATPAPSAKRGNSEDLAIEQQFVCACCSQHYGYQIEHADVCQYAHTERYMLPIAKAQFRERRKQIEYERTQRLQNARDAMRLSRLESLHLYSIDADEYSRLTGHKFE